MHLPSSSPRSTREALMITIDTESSSCCSPPATKSCRRVRIFEEENKYYPSSETTIDKSLWYKTEDFLSFERQAKLLATALQASTDHQSWSHSLMRVYFTLRVANSTAEAKQVMEASDISLDERTLGLHDRFITPICNDFVVRRRHLMNQVFRLQCSRFPSEHHRDNVIQETSRLNSHAARLYARFVAESIAR